MYRHTRHIGLMVRAQCVPGRLHAWATMSYQCSEMVLYGRGVEETYPHVRHAASALCRIGVHLGRPRLRALASALDMGVELISCSASPQSSTGRKIFDNCAGRAQLQYRLSGEDGVGVLAQDAAQCVAWGAQFATPWYMLGHIPESLRIHCTVTGPWRIRPDGDLHQAVLCIVGGAAKVMMSTGDCRKFDSGDPYIGLQKLQNAILSATEPEQHLVA